MLSANMAMMIRRLASSATCGTLTLVTTPEDIFCSTRKCNAAVRQR
jgi:hypothetical protein